MSAHSPAHEELVDRILGGDLAEDDPRARAQLAACPECRAQLARLRALDAHLRAAAQQASADVEAARADASPAEETLVRGSLVASLAGRRNGHRWPGGYFVLALAAGLLVLLGVGLFKLSRFRGLPEGPEILLHGGEISCQRPVGPVSDYHEFAWSADLPPGGHFELHIRPLDQDKAGTGPKVIPLQEPRWIPSAEEKEALGDEIYWEIHALDVSDVIVKRGWATASRSSR